jgi:membrane-bound lytic murein transglycosylase A
MQENQSYVFFRELPQAEAGAGPVGAQGVPLTPGRSLAVDATFHTLGTPIFVAAPHLAVEGAPFRRLMIAQDVGSAIKGPQRGDIFFGTGEAAGAIAGTTKAAAEFYILVPNR